MIQIDFGSLEEHRTGKGWHTSIFAVWSLFLIQISPIYLKGGRSHENFRKLKCYKAKELFCRSKKPKKQKQKKNNKTKTKTKTKKGKEKKKSQENKKPPKSKTKKKKTHSFSKTKCLQCF